MLACLTDVLLPCFCFVLLLHAGMFCKAGQRPGGGHGVGHAADEVMREGVHAMHAAQQASVVVRLRSLRSSAPLFDL